jgi:BirA family biotin operon repressor/biotin-[acetyl-CoA-carboxylase] ligase
MRPNHAIGQGPVLPNEFRLITLPSLGSTNDEVARYARAGEPAGLVVSAGEQRRGKGRFRRPWSSPEGGLYCSLLLRPACPAQRAPELGFVAAVALADAIAGVIGPGAVACKWPNDLLLHGRKVAGILLESATDTAGRLDWVVLGIGVNVATQPPPEAVQYPATCLAREGAATLTSDQLREKVLAHLARWLATWSREGFAPVRLAWRRLAYRMGKELVVNVGDRPLHGRFIDIDATGALVLETAGRRHVITAADCLPPASD